MIRIIYTIFAVGDEKDVVPTDEVVLPFHVGPRPRYDRPQLPGTLEEPPVLDPQESADSRLSNAVLPAEQQQFGQTKRRTSVHGTALVRAEG